MLSPYCPVHREVVEAIAYIEDSERGIVIGTDGKATGFYLDGVRGPDKEEIALAEEEDTIYCLLCEQNGEATEIDWIRVADVRVQQGDTVDLIHPQNYKVEKWFDQNVPDQAEWDGTTAFAGRTPQRTRQIVKELNAAGFSVEVYDGFVR